jgi:outer membrane protein OmpA-like peptidoglycan-associated protein
MPRLSHPLRLVGVALMALGLLDAHTVLAGNDPLPQPDESDPAPAPARASAPLVLTVDKSKVDLKEHHLELRPSNALVKLTVKVYGDSGSVLADETQTASHAAGAPYLVRWSPSSDEVVAQIDVGGYDAGGSTYTVTVTPWTVAIPHEEVTFKTGSARIEDSETPKLDTSLSRVTDALARHPDLHGTLFIAGHTDTVGDPASNFRLSRQRALAIATWFRQHAAKKYVVSSTLDRVDWNAELVRGDLGKVVSQLKQESGKGLLVGGLKLPLALAELGLIDEYELVVHPRLVGHGPMLFAGLSKHVDLRLVSRLELGSGAVAMRYEPRT